jgi:hypothetical protein
MWRKSLVHALTVACLHAVALELTSELISNGFATMAAQLTGEYVLTFAPERLDGKLQDLTIRTRQSDRVVRSTRKFLAPSPRTSP